MHLGVKDTGFSKMPSGSRYRRWRADASLLARRRACVHQLSIWHWPKAEEAALQVGAKRE